VVFIAALFATVHSTDISTAASRLVYLGLFALLTWALTASISDGRMTVHSLVVAIVLGATLAGVALVGQVVVQFAVGQLAVTNWLSAHFGLFAGSRAAGITTTTGNWIVSYLGIVRGIFPFMAAPSAGQYEMLGLVAGIWLWRTSSGEPRRWMLFSANVLMGLALLATLSRQSWIGFLAGLGALSLRRDPLKPVSIVAILFILLAVTPVPGGHSTFGDYILTASDTATVSSATRLNLLSQALQLVPHHALIGVGPGLYGTLNPDPADPVYYAHNVWLDELVELGIVGGVALILTFVAAMRSAWRRHATVGFSLLAAFVVANLFDDVLYFPRNLILLAAVFALATVSDADADRGGQTRTGIRLVAVHPDTVQPRSTPLPRSSSSTASERSSTASEANSGASAFRPS
jgi:O-antigen ligase